MTNSRATSRLQALQKILLAAQQAHAKLMASHPKGWLATERGKRMAMVGDDLESAVDALAWALKPIKSKPKTESKVYKSNTSTLGRTRLKGRPTMGTPPTPPPLPVEVDDDDPA